MANAASTLKRAHVICASPDEGEVWVGSHGCHVSVRGRSVTETSLLEGTPLLKGGAQGSPLLLSALEQIGEYLQGERRSFSLECFMEGPPFYRKVWETLRGIPYGSTISYGDLAALSGRPGSARAVGSAMARNPLVLIVPCHRVVGAGGKLGGFSCGTAWKKFLLNLEQGGKGSRADLFKSGEDS